MVYFSSGTIIEDKLEDGEGATEQESKIPLLAPSVAKISTLLKLIGNLVPPMTFYFHNKIEKVTQKDELDFFFHVYAS